VGPRAGLDGRKISSPPGFDPGPGRSSVTIPTELPGPLTMIVQVSKYAIYVTKGVIQLYNSSCDFFNVKTDLVRKWEMQLKKLGQVNCSIILYTQFFPDEQMLLQKRKTSQFSVLTLHHI